MDWYIKLNGTWVLVNFDLEALYQQHLRGIDVSGVVLRFAGVGSVGADFDAMQTDCLMAHDCPPECNQFRLRRGTHMELNA